MSKKMKVTYSRKLKKGEKMEIMVNQPLGHITPVFNDEEKEFYTIMTKMVTGVFENGGFAYRFASEQELQGYAEAKEANNAYYWMEHDASFGFEDEAIANAAKIIKENYFDAGTTTLEAAKSYREAVAFLFSNRAAFNTGILNSEFFINAHITRAYLALIDDLIAEWEKN